MAKACGGGKGVKAGSSYKAGGPTSMDRKKMGRNLARVANQRGSARGR